MTVKYFIVAAFYKKGSEAIFSYHWQRYYVGLHLWKACRIKVEVRYELFIQTNSRTHNPVLRRKKLISYQLILQLIIYGKTFAD